MTMKQRNKKPRGEMPGRITGIAVPGMEKRKRKPRRDTETLRLRMPKTSLMRLKLAAEKESRSQHNLAVMLLVKALDKR